LIPICPASSIRDFFVKNCCQVPLLSTTFERAALPFFPDDNAAFGRWGKGWQVKFSLLL
jgi:hypothetical protein